MPRVREVFADAHIMPAGGTALRAANLGVLDGAPSGRTPVSSGGGAKIASLIEAEVEAADRVPAAPRNGTRTAPI